MSWDLDGQTADLESALAGGAPQRVGWFRFYFIDQRWEWSEQVHLMHGYEPGTITPTTELVLAHKHPDDLPHIVAAIEEMLATHRGFSTRHRIVDTGGDVHQVVVVGDQLHDDHGAVVGTHGFYVDVAREVEQEQLVTEKLAEIAENRAAIEQAKGMLMLIYGIDDNAAFDLLKWLSQEANVKLRLLAEQICADFRALGPSVLPRTEFDQLLVTARLRVSSA
jgi:fructose-specific component phosphotransferase system IIB-like protein